jgi:radical SAM superfamily enzyme YgiQ (UPF0313 family)
MKEIKNVLLLSPPGKEKYIRDYYCSKTAKASYINAPIDLVVLSGILNKEFTLHLVDAIVENLDEELCMKRIEIIRPDAIISLVGSVSWKEDISFLKKVKKEIGCKIIIGGDLLLTKAKEKLEENHEIDCIISDFTDSSIVIYLKGKTNGLTGLTYRSGSKIVNTPKGDKKMFSIGIPSHDLFIKKQYKLPFVKRFPFTTVLTDFGSPFQCTFCIMNNLADRYKYRDIDEVIEELTYLKKLGVKTIFFADQTFGINRERTIHLCKKILHDFDFEWICFSRVDVVDHELLKLMKMAGCILIMFGVEFGNDQTLKEYQKGYTKAKIQETFALTKKVGIETLATFLMGVPSEDKKKCMETIDFALELNPDFASFNFAVPRFNTKLRDEAIKKGLIKEDTEVMDQAGTFISMPTSALSKKEVGELRRRAISRFYFRPSYIAKRIIRIRTRTQLREYLSNFFSLCRGFLK